MIYFVYLPKPYLTNPSAQLGLGLLSLATYAKSLGAQVKVLDGQSKSDKWMPDVPENSTVCIGACLVDIPILNRTIEYLAEKKCRVIVGGPVVESANLILKKCTFVYGVGEPYIEKILGVETKNSFEDYPIPDRSLLEVKGGNIFNKATGVKSDASTTIITSRGCLYKCAFCMSGNDDMFHEYSLKRIERELDIIDGLGIKYLRISDDNILCKKDRFEAICKLLGRHNFTWRASIRTYPNDIDIYRRMHDNGCIELSFGVESGDQNVLDIMNKGTRVEWNSTAVENADKAGMKNVRALLMMATPGETRETVEKNKAWVDKHKVTVSMCIFYPFPGTAIYENPGKFGCRIESTVNPNICMFRADGSSPEAHISIVGGLTRKELTENFVEMAEYLGERANRG